MTQQGGSTPAYQQKTVTDPIIEEILHCQRAKFHMEPYIMK